TKSGNPDSGQQPRHNGRPRQSNAVVRGVPGRPGRPDPRSRQQKRFVGQRPGEEAAEAVRREACAAMQLCLRAGVHGDQPPAQHPGRCRAPSPSARQRRHLGRRDRSAVPSAGPAGAPALRPAGRPAPLRAAGRPDQSDSAASRRLGRTGRPRGRPAPPPVRTG
uniref:Mobile element protein n=1 Tax=Macrostomum lignano TaxID=282301 RepID=A0A1I8HUY3_9PLAT